MKKREFVKIGLDLLVTAGVGIVINQMAKQLVPADLGLVKKIGTTIGVAAISSAVGSAVSAHILGQADTFFDSYDTGRQKAEARMAQKQTDAVVETDSTESDQDETSE